MPYFPTPPSLQPLGNGAWRVPEDYAAPVDRAWLVIPMGFVTDLASVPRWLTPFIQRDELGGAAPLLHDYLYQTGGHAPAAELTPERTRHELDLTRRQVDALFRLFMRLEQVPAWRRGVAWLAVRFGGWLCWKHARAAEVGIIEKES